MVDAAAAQPPLGQHLGAVGRAEQVVERDPHVVVADVGVDPGPSSTNSTPGVFVGTTNIPFVDITNRMSA